MTKLIKIFKNCCKCFKIVIRGFKMLPVGVLALAAEVTMPKLVMASVKPPYTMLFIISTLLPPLWPNVSSPLAGGIVKAIDSPPSISMNG